jgi:hypothetical protein
LGFSSGFRPLFPDIREAGFLEVFGGHDDLELNVGVEGEKPWLGNRGDFRRIGEDELFRGSARTANSVQATGFFEGEKGFRRQCNRGKSLAGEGGSAVADRVGRLDTANVLS